MKEINEVRGVPEDILDYSRKVFNELLDNLKNNNLNRLNNDLVTHIKLKQNFLKDSVQVEIEGIIITVMFQLVTPSRFKQIINNNKNVKERTDRLILNSLGMRFYEDLFLSKKYNRKIKKEKNPDLSIVFVQSTKLMDSEKQKEVYTLISNNYENMLDKFSHEIKHHVDMEVKGEDDMSLRAKYISVSTPGVSDTKTMSTFLFNLYYLTEIENLVRPTEFKSELINKKVTKKNFLKSYYESDIYKKFNECKDMTYEKLLLDLKIEAQKNLPKHILQNKNIDKMLFKIISSTLNNLLRVGTDYLRYTISTAMNNMSTDERRTIFKNKLKKFLKNHLFIKYYSDGKTVNVEETFKKMIQDMNLTAIRMMKKIAKIYEDMPYEY